MCGRYDICVSSFSCSMKINSTHLWLIKALLRVVCMPGFFFAPLFGHFFEHLPALIWVMSLCFWMYCIPVCLCVSKPVSKLVIHACHPLHASFCTTELHMTSIWEQWDSDLITNSLLLIKTCRLHPPPSPFLFFSLLSALSCFLVLCSPPTSSTSPQFQSRTILWFLRCSLPKKGPISSSAESYKLLFFIRFRFSSLFRCSFFCAGTSLGCVYQTSPLPGKCSSLWIYLFWC